MSNDLILILLAIAVVAVGLYFTLKPGKSPAAMMDASAETQPNDKPRVEAKAAEEPMTGVDVTAFMEVEANAAPTPTVKAPVKVPVQSEASAQPKAAANSAATTKVPAPASSVRKAATQAVRAAAAEKPKAAKSVPATKPAAKAVAKPNGPDNLLWIKGLGPKLNTLFIENGVTRFEQIAGWGATEIAAMDAKLGSFSGRIARDNFVEQAALLAKGDVASFEAKYGKLDSENG